MTLLFPRKSTDAADPFTDLTAFEFACLFLRFPKSGTGWLDNLIRHSREHDRREIREERAHDRKEILDGFDAQHREELEQQRKHDAEFSEKLLKVVKESGQ